MIRRVELTGLHLDIDKSMHEYAVKKLATLDRYLPRHKRLSAHLEIRLQAVTHNGAQQYICEATLFAPRKVYIATERKQSMLTAVDAVHVCLRRQICKRRQEFGGGKRHRHAFARFHRRLAFETFSLTESR